MQAGREHQVAIHLPSVGQLEGANAVDVEVRAGAHEGNQGLARRAHGGRQALDVGLGQAGQARVVEWRRVQRERVDFAEARVDLLDVARDATQGAPDLQPQHRGDHAVLGQCGDAHGHARASVV